MIIAHKSDISIISQNTAKLSWSRLLHGHENGCDSIYVRLPSGGIREKQRHGGKTRNPQLIGVFTEQGCFRRVSMPNDIQRFYHLYQFTIISIAYVVYVLV